MNNTMSIGAEVKRVRLIAFLAAFLLVLALLLDGPVTTLGWLLGAGSLLCIAYVLAASYHLSNSLRLHDDKADQHDETVS